MTRRALRDAARLGLQSAVAAAGAFTAAQSFGTESTFLAVISAVLVVQGSVDGTYHAAAWRIAATLLGAALGYLSVLLLSGDALTVWRIVLVTLLVSAISAFKTGLRYAIVVGVIIVLGTGAGPLEEAQNRSLGVLIGAAVGLLAALLVWPESAFEHARRRLRDSLGDCRALLDAAVEDAIGGPQRDLDPLHGSFSRNIGEAREAAQAVRWRRRKAGAPLRGAVHAVERLWHALVIIDRAISGDGHPHLERTPEVRETVRELQRAACGAIGRAAAGEAIDEELLKELDDSAEPARRSAVELARSGHGETRETIAGAALVFGLGEVVRNIREVELLMRKADAKG